MGVRGNGEERRGPERWWWCCASNPTPFVEVGGNIPACSPTESLGAFKPIRRIRIVEEWWSMEREKDGEERCGRRELIYIFIILLFIVMLPWVQWQWRWSWDDEDDVVDGEEVWELYYFGELKKKGWKSQSSSHLIIKLKLLLKIPTDILAERKTFCLSPASSRKLF